VILRIQPQYQNEFELIFQKLNSDEKFFEFEANNKHSPHLIAGDLNFLLSECRLSLIEYKILILDDSERIESNYLVEFSRYGCIKTVKKNQIKLLENTLFSFQNAYIKKNQIANIKLEIQKKRHELEELNLSLRDESDKKLKFLARSHIEETEKNQKEKSLLHFLDFIQSESIRDDFTDRLFRFFWKDLKKFCRVYSLGISAEYSRTKNRISFYDGLALSTSVGNINFSENNSASQLASIWGRPVGKILTWNLPEFSRPAHLFIELVDSQSDLSKVRDYFNERIAVISMYLDRWMIENEFQIVVERWRNTFKSFSGFTHVVDDEFNIYHANYQFDSNEQNGTYKKCYIVLANREIPCENCPILKKQNTSFSLKPGVQVKTYHSQFRFENKRYFFMIYEDITKILHLQSQIIQTEKMSTLGRLGNHLAHELNNPLTGIQSYVQTLLEDSQYLSTLPATARTDMNEILKATVRCQKIIKNFIDFSQNKEPVLEKTTFKEVLQNTIVLLKTALRNHRLFVDLKDDAVMANTHDLQQVLFNLIKNACQAMANSGSIKIYQEYSEDKIYYHIEDSGPGFSDSILKNIFQPFMTTKAKGEGTGLGLYLSKKLINNMQADMQISSSSKGAKVTLIFDRL
jgi:two-component system NtrC family sensor kinase